MFRIGVDFIEIDDKEREIINKTVEATLRREKSTLLTQMILDKMESNQAKEEFMGAVCESIVN